MQIFLKASEEGNILDWIIGGQIIINGVLIGGIYALIAIGLTFILGVLKIVNFAHGSFIMMGMYLSYILFRTWGMDPNYSIFLSIPFFGLLGFSVYAFLIKKVFDAPQHVQILLTFALSIVIDNLALMLFGATPLYLRTSYSDTTLSILDCLYVSLPRLSTFFLSFLLIGALYLGLKKTDIGRAIVASSQSVMGAELLGMNVKKLYSIAFSVGIIYTGIGGILQSLVFYVSPTVSITFCLKAFVIIVLGGTGSFMGAVVGGLIIGIVESFSGFYCPGTLQDLVILGIFIFTLLIKPAGIFGGESRG